MTQSYYSNVRDDILSMVPAGARRVLSLGCGEGRTEAVLVREGRTVVGVELFPDAAAVARDNGLDVHVGDLEEIGPNLRGSSFDCLIFGDILEHVRRPEVVFSSLCELLPSGGHAIVSVPNFRNFEVFRQLFLRGEVRYADAGIFDRTHLRLTTRKMVRRWFADANLVPDRTLWNISRRRVQIMARLSAGLLNDILASQVVLRGVKQ